MFAMEFIKEKPYPKEYKSRPVTNSHTPALFTHLCLLACALFVATTTLGSAVIRCQDAKGKWIFTDNKRLCPTANDADSIPAEEYQIKVHNLHSQFGSMVNEEFYNYPFRAYEAVSGYSLNIVAEKLLIEKDPELLRKAIAKLEKSVGTALSTLPSHIKSQFHGVRYLFFTGDESRTGGRKGGQWYFRKGNHISPRFDDSIVIRSTKDYLNNYDANRSSQTALHELSHAYFDYHRKEIYWDVKKAYDNAIASKLYLNVQTHNGATIKKAYALTNHNEYFAELSKTYHLGSYHYPFNREDLRQYDPLGFEMIESAFHYRM